MTEIALCVYVRDEKMVPTYRIERVASMQSFEHEVYLYDWLENKIVLGKLSVRDWITLDARLVGYRERHYIEQLITSIGYEVMSW